LALTSPTIGGRSVGRDRLWLQAMEFLKSYNNNNNNNNVIVIIIIAVIIIVVVVIIINLNIIIALPVAERRMVKLFLHS
jgi:hypothetical protein